MKKKSTAKRQYKRYRAKAYAYLRLCNGWDRKEIIESMMEYYDYAESTCVVIYDKAKQTYENHLMNDAEKIMNKNMRRLDAIIDAAVDDADSATILKAIDIQNKACGVYQTNVNIKGEGDAPFTIKISD